jgi:hypothetical protein
MYPAQSRTGSARSTASTFPLSDVNGKLRLLPGTSPSVTTPCDFYEHPVRLRIAASPRDSALTFCMENVVCFLGET